ncbi:hypothetical protein SNE40_001535 [Patella caerulea]|uniref:Uncharacterized protein n=1 Tax=Patella caerulea TaxID=87958 RepID=A0AAN8KIX7_PATCE
MKGRKRKIDKGGKQSSSVTPGVEEASSTQSSENKSTEPQKIVPVFTTKKRKLMEDKPKTIESVLRDETKDSDSQTQTSQESVVPELGTHEKQKTTNCEDGESKQGTQSTLCPFSLASGAKLNTVKEDHMTKISKSETTAGGPSITDMNLMKVEPKIAEEGPLNEKALVTRVGTMGEELVLEEDESEIKADIPQTIGCELSNMEEDRETKAMDDGIKMPESKSKRNSVEPKIDKSMILAEEDQSNGIELDCKLTQRTEGVIEDTRATVEESYMGNGEPQLLIENNLIIEGENVLQDATYGVENPLLDLSQPGSKDCDHSSKLEEVGSMKLLHSRNNSHMEPNPATEHGLPTGDIQQKTEFESDQSPVNDDVMTVREGYIYREAIIKIESRTTEAKSIKEQSDKQDYHSEASCSPRQTETTALQESCPSNTKKTYEDLDVPVVPTQTFTISYSPNLSQDTPISGPSSPIKLSEVVENNEQSMSVDMNFVNNLSTSLQTLTNKSLDDVSEKMCHRTTSTNITQQATAETGKLPRCLSTIKSESLAHGLKGEKTERADNRSYILSETAQVPLDIGMDDDFEVTDSQLCALNIDVPLTSSKSRSVSIRSLDAKIDLKETEGHTIMEGFINDVSKLNKLILKTKREIDAMKRRSGQNLMNQNWHAS